MIIPIKVKPGSGRDGLKLENDLIVVQVKAQAADGKANEAVIRFLAARLGVPKSRISILSGHTTRFKRIGLPDEAARRLLELASLA